MLVDFGNDESTSNKYRNGDYMYWTILHDLKILKMTYILKLTKIKQNDISILYQLISDLQNENKKLRNTINDHESKNDNQLVIGSWTNDTSNENRY